MSSLASDKLSAEIEKLRLENAQLRRPLWHNPAIVAAVGGLIMSLTGNVQQLVSSSRHAEEARRQLDLANRTWDDQRKKLMSEKDKMDEELSILRKRERLNDEERQSIKQKLAAIERDIGVWERGIFDSQTKLMLERASLDSEMLNSKNTKGGKSPMVLAYEKNIDSINDLKAEQTRQRDALVARRSELEKRLSCP